MMFKILTTFLMIVFCNYSLALTDLIFKANFEYPMQKLNDTGITWAGEHPSGNNVDCSSSTITSPQDCNTGRDVTHYDDSDGHAGFSFTKLDATGMPLVDQSVTYDVMPWACVRDNVTGLVWEVKTDDAGIHNKDNTYKWGGITAIGFGQPGSGSYFNDWDELVNGSNAEEGLCGFNNWRVPAFDELSGITNQGTFDPAIDTNYFPNTALSWFWSSSPNAGHNGISWVIYFKFGYGTGRFRDTHNRVRLVSSLGQ